MPTIDNLEKVDESKPKLPDGWVWVQCRQCKYNWSKKGQTVALCACCFSTDVELLAFLVEDTGDVYVSDKHRPSREYAILEEYRRAEIEED